MGCDIHMWAEATIRFNERHTKRAMLGRIFSYPYHREGVPPTVEIDIENGCRSEFEWNERFSIHPYSERNYDLFAMLADVRNGHGFAGVKTSYGFAPICDPKGVPEDATDFYRHEVESWGEDGHSHSWLTLEELRAYDWEGQHVRHVGVVSPAEYQVFLEKGKPEMWSGDVSGPRVLKITNEAMQQKIAAGEVTTKPFNEMTVDEREELFSAGANHYYTTIEWEESYAEAAGTFLTGTLPRLEEIAAMESVEDLRIVFFFDN